MIQFVPAEEIPKLFTAYLDATGSIMPLRPFYERALFEAAKEGLTAEMLTLVIKDRQRRVSVGVRHKESLLLCNLVSGEDNLARTLDEAYSLLAVKRKVVDVAKEAVLADWRGVKQEDTTPRVRSSQEALAAGWSEVRKAMGA